MMGTDCLSWNLQLEFFLRIILSSLCGVMIGFERAKRFKEAGIRTHCLVACGAALFMIMSKYGFADTLNEAGEFLYGTKGADSSRIAAQVVSGVGFLGAGVIFRTGMSIKGLTTAAGLWATSAVGLALGAGMYGIGALTTVLIVLEQYFMHWFHIGNEAYISQELSITFHYSSGLQDCIFGMLSARGGIIFSCRAEKNGGDDITYHMVIRIKEPIAVQEMQELMERHQDISAFSV